MLCKLPNHCAILIRIGAGPTALVGSCAVPANYHCP